MNARIHLTRAMLLGATLILGACSGKPAEQHVATPPGPPQWTGVWTAAGMVMNIDGYTPTDPAVMAAPPPALFIFNPSIPWNDATRKKVKAIIDAGHGDPTHNNPRGSLGWGYPLMMIGPTPLQFVVTPGVTLVFNQYRDMREIYTDGRGHQPADEGWPATTWGDSIGHWEGDTLVFETTGVRDPQSFFGIAAPFSEKARYSERLRQTAPDRIEGEMSIEDPETLTSPLQVKLAFARSKELERMVLDTFSNDRTGYDGEFSTIEADKR